MTVQLSPSRLNLFADCPRCFWLRINEGVERPDGPFPSLPSGMDDAIKTHFDRHRRQGTVPPAIGGLDAPGDGSGASPDAAGYRLFADQEVLDGFRRWQGEPSYAIPGTDAVIRGGVDDLLRGPGGAVAVLDYKTRGYPPGDGVPGYYRRQLGTYALLLREAGHDVADEAFLLYYHPDDVTDDGAATFATELRRVPVDVGAVEDLAVAAVDTLNGPLPAPADDCGYCGFVAAREER